MRAAFSSIRFQWVFCLFLFEKTQCAMGNHAILHILVLIVHFCLCCRTLQMELFFDAQSKTNNTVHLSENGSLIKVET